MKNDKQKPEKVMSEKEQGELWNKLEKSDFIKPMAYHPKAPLSNETKVVESVPIKSVQETINYLVGYNGYPHLLSLLTRMQRIDQEQFIINCMETYASQFKNTDAVKVITDRIAELKNNLAFNTGGWIGNKLKYQLQEAKDILKLIQL
jgi:hypothetical protein